MLLEALASYPYEGLTRELLALGMSWVVMETGLEPDEEELSDALEGALNSLGSRVKIHTSKMGRNDRSSFDKVLQAWFGRSAPETYGELFELVASETIKLLREGKIDPRESLSTIKTDKNGTYLGVAYKGEQAILPAIIKQPEYYERQSGFLSPTTGQKAQIRMDPLWFSFIALGFFTSFAGFIGGKYYLMTKPGIEGFWPHEVEKVIEKGLLLLTGAGASGRISLSTEELYEMKLAMKLAEEGKNVVEEVYPVTLHLISLEGQVYTELKTVQLNLAGLSEYMKEYLNRVGAVTIGGLPLLVELKDGKATIQKYPLWALVDIAEKELRKGVNGDGEMLAYIFVKDLYRAINSGRKEVIRDAVFRLFRQGRALLEGSGRASGEFRKVMRTFMWQEHLEVLL
ncbi:type I-A CRISPR-associated protein Cas8a2/Csx9 [Thermococcus celericrescens]|uniref:Type I-A CRISPR-associated protein Cas8a2/Csx9 n=1 Tax=Thermococcus celericrescens TaxID=227598 RepID=A0A100XX17_9EURY|nr:type I-A CRISPR-associated protein Cas8a2/Csx9 [Thermococcus celericrescens]KUH32857.1 type I-A CRISPR-associated protein Cas8a2/Csx9 [Thermococcus celericrescens]